MFYQEIVFIRKNELVVRNVQVWGKYIIINAEEITIKSHQAQLNEFIFLLDQTAFPFCEKKCCENTIF